jgi:hypothetical protein
MTTLGLMTNAVTRGSSPGSDSGGDGWRVLLEEAVTSGDHLPLEVPAVLLWSQPLPRRHGQLLGAHPLSGLR